MSPPRRVCVRVRSSLRSNKPYQNACKRWVGNIDNRDAVGAIQVDGSIKFYHRDAVEITGVDGRYTESAAVQGLGALRTFSHLRATTDAWPIASEPPDGISIELAFLNFFPVACSHSAEGSILNIGRVILQLRGHTLIRFSSDQGRHG
jgi:hypothetical protein